MLLVPVSLTLILDRISRLTLVLLRSITALVTFSNESDIRHVDGWLVTAGSDLEKNDLWEQLTPLGVCSETLNR